MNSTLSDLFNQFMVSGVIESNISEDGGLQCYQQIPFDYHIAFVVVLSVIHLAFFLKWKKHLSYTVKQQGPSRFETRFALFALLSWILTLYFKLKTRKGLFMFNPCHIAILIQIYLLFSKNTKRNIAVYTAWSGWLFGPYMATFIPHTNGIDDFQVFLYYFEHLAITPLGYLVLNKRYRFSRPTLTNHLPAFSTIALYQFWVLAPLSRNTMVNLNFALCHSPADPSFDLIGPFYFVACTLFLNIFSYLVRWASYLQIKIFYVLLSLIGIKSPQIIPDSSESIETPGETKKS